MSVENQTLLRRATRLHKIGQLYLDIDPKSKKTGIAENVFSVQITEDAKLPEILEPKDQWEAEYAAANLRANAKADAMPTSIENSTVYSVRKGANAGEVCLISHETRVDLGYKIPVVEADTGNTDSDRRTIIDFLVQQFQAFQNRTDKERTEDKWNTALRSTLLADRVREAVLEPSAIQAGKMEVILQDSMTGLSRIVPVALDKSECANEGVENFLITLEFNLLSRLQQIRFKAKPEVRKRIDEILNDYFGR